MNNVYVIFVVLVAFAVTGAWTLKDVTLDIEPPVVKRGENALLRCNYDLQGMPLYSVKCYRGHHEFFRYLPNGVPRLAFFPFYRMNFDVTVKLSDDHQVVLLLHNMDLDLSGEFSCEVTTDAPTFSTVTASRNLSVVDDHVKGTTTETKTDFSAEGKGFNCVERICENGTGYPYQYIKNVVKKFEQLNIFGPGKRGSYVPQNRIITPHVENENVLCDVYTIAKFPQIMTNESNVQKYIVNDESYKQGVVFEICVNKSKCSPAEFPESYLSECVQKYTRVRLLAINIDDGEPEFNDFIIPSTCVCTFKKPFLH